MWRALASNGLTLLVVALFLLAGMILWGKNQYTAPGPLAEPICLRVESGDKIRDVAARLDGEGAITSTSIFRMGADYTGRSGALKAGSFLVQDGASMEEIVGIVTGSGRSTCGTEVHLRAGIASSRLIVSELDPATNRYEELVSFDPLADEETPETYGEIRDDPDVRFRLTFAEGVTSWQVVQALQAADFLEGDLEESPAEGTLAPDSYEVRRGTTRAELVAQMQQKQEAILLEAWQNRAEGLPVSTPEEALILASIVEKETGIPEERRQVASVFVNRLEEGMRLQTDPTVIYGITRGQGVLGRGLRQSELRGATPWNTYVIEGLPPTPIANPGRASIEAALDPAETDYLFFVADGSGGHVFAETLAEHNENVARWRQIEAEEDSQ